MARFPIAHISLRRPRRGDARHFRREELPTSLPISGSLRIEFGEAGVVGNARLLTKASRRALRGGEDGSERCSWRKRGAGNGCDL